MTGIGFRNTAITALGALLLTLINLGCRSADNTNWYSSDFPSNQGTTATCEEPFYETERFSVRRAVGYENHPNPDYDGFFTVGAAIYPK
jgi:hypothetical protein